MEKINYQGKVIEVTEPEFDLICGMLMIEGMMSGLNGKRFTPEESEKVKDNTVKEVLKMREENND